MKVYCKQCRWYGAGRDWGTDRCLHPSNIGDLPKQRYYRHDGCETKNKLNSCSDFERRLSLTERLMKFLSV